MLLNRVTHGANDGYFLVAGKSVALVRRSLSTALNIPSWAYPLVNGAEVGLDYRLGAGDWLEFLIEWGWKGALRKYATILADPPWPYASPRAVVGNGGRGSAGGRARNMIQVDVTSRYRTMSVEAIKRLPVHDLAAEAAHLYLWTTNAFMVEAHEVARAWGFQPKTILTWVKVRHQDGQPSMKAGYWYRSATEHIVFAVRGKQRLLGPAVPTAFLLPRLPHSVKPEFFCELIEEQSPGPYLELFARHLRPGWDSWGDEIEPTIQFP